jgi:hypothetical protein
MDSPNTPQKIIAVAKIVTKFLLGSAIGLFLVVILYSNFQFSMPILATFQIICSCLLILTCGILSAIWGSRFLSVVFQGLLDSLNYMP